MESRERYRQVARLHVDNINQGFLATLGVGFVSLMYQAIEESRDSVLLVEERDGRIVGFVSGGLGMRSIYRRMLRHPIRLIASLLPSLLHPGHVLRILEILRYSSGATQVELPQAELLSIAVDADYRGQLVAEALYRRLKTCFSGEGISLFKIVVGEGLEPAHRFYRRMGARPVTMIEVHKGEKSTVYVQSAAAWE